MTINLTPQWLVVIIVSIVILVIYRAVREQDQMLGKHRSCLGTLVMAVILAAVFIFIAIWGTLHQAPTP